MSLLFRYILARYLAHLTIITLTLLGLYLAIDSPERLGQGSAVLARIPLMLTHLLPVAAPAALLTTFHRLRVTGVIVTLRSSGVSWARILSPALGGGVVAAALHGSMALVISPMSLATAERVSATQPPRWFLDDGHIVHHRQDGALESWEPGEGPSPLEGVTEEAAQANLALLGGRPVAERSTTADLMVLATAAESMGHDARAERVELWTRILLVVALLMAMATCAVAVVRQRGPWRSASRLLVALVCGWLGLTVAIHLFVNGAAPDWALLVMPGALLALCLASPWP